MLILLYGENVSLPNHECDSRDYCHYLRSNLNLYLRSLCLSAQKIGLKENNIKIKRQAQYCLEEDKWQLLLQLMRGETIGYSRDAT